MPHYTVWCCFAVVGWLCWSCQSTTPTVALPDEDLPYTTFEGEQFDQCKGHGWQQTNKYQETVFHQVRCTGDQTGYYWVYTEQLNGARDTLLYLPFVSNPDYQPPTERERLLDPLPQQFYPYLAQGEAYLGPYLPWRTYRNFTHQEVYIAPDSAFAISPLVDRLAFEERPLGVAFVHYGAQRGWLERGKRTGQWVFRAHSDPFFVPFDTSRVLAHWQMHQFENGLVEGTSVVYTEFDSSGQRAWGKDLLYERRYHKGQLHGWQRDHTPTGGVDSVWYKEGQRR